MFSVYFNVQNEQFEFSTLLRPFGSSYMELILCDMYISSLQSFMESDILAPPRNWVCSSAQGFLGLSETVCVTCVCDVTGRVC